MSETIINAKVNGEPIRMSVEPNQTALHLIRDELGLTGAKAACEEGRCGSCTIILDGETINACLVLAPELDGRDVMTIEGLAHDDRLNTVQEAFIDAHGLQCGYCTPGMILATSALLAEAPDADEHKIREDLSGNICRCTGYVKILDAVLLAQHRLSKQGATP